MKNQFGPFPHANAFPFQFSNRNDDGRWDAPLADRANILGTSVDPREPIWPRWKRTPPPHHEGDFVSDDPFFDIDEISGRVEFYPPGRALHDGNVDGHPARRQRVDDLPAGNSWRRRLLVAQGDELGDYVRLAQDVKDPSRPQPNTAAGEIDMEPPSLKPMPFERTPGFFYFYTAEPSWEIDPQGRPTPYGTGHFIPGRDDWPPPRGDGFPDGYQPGSPRYSGKRLIRPKVG